MKSGTRALGVAESYRGDRSTLAGCVVRADRVLDGIAYASCAVGGTDATEGVVRLVDRLGRADIRYILLAGIAPAWFNVLDLHRLHEECARPVLSVSFESSEGLGDAIRESFEGAARERRLELYRAQPERRPVDVGDERVFVRSVGVDDETAGRVVDAFTPVGGRPEPLRLARLAARAADTFRRA